MLAPNMAGRHWGQGTISWICFSSMRRLRSVKYASKELKRLNSRLNAISDAWWISQSIDAFEMYSYHFNIKVIGLPLLEAKETTEQIASLCLQLFHQMGVKDVSINDIDIAHRVPSRNPSNRADAIVCKFVRRMVKEKNHGFQEYDKEHNSTATRDFPQGLMWVIFMLTIILHLVCKPFCVRQKSSKKPIASNSAGQKMVQYFSGNQRIHRFANLQILRTYTHLLKDRDK